MLRAGPAVAYLRFPRFPFRPSHANALHCYLWVTGRNIPRDAGSFSYNVSAADTAYFSGTESHNTVQFDNRDQMPRLSRFQFGDWLNTETLDVLNTTAYIHAKGVEHSRKISLSEDSLFVTDEVSGFQTATLR